MPRSRPERAARGARRIDESATYSRRRWAWLRVISSFLVVAGGFFVHAVVVPGGAATAADLTATTSVASTALLEREAAIVGRLVDTATDPGILRLADSRTGPPDARLISWSLEQLRGADGAVVRNACVARLSERGRTPIDGGVGDPKAAACVDRGLRDAATAAGPGGVARATRTTAGADRLLLATLMRDADGQAFGVLSIDVDIAGLLQMALPETSETIATMVIDLDTSNVLAASGWLPVVGPGRLTDAPPLEPNVSGLLAAAEGSGSEAGLATSIVPLWPLSSGGQLGLFELGPAVAPVVIVTTGPSEVGMLVGMSLLVLVLAVVGLTLRRAARIGESRARVRGLYQQAHPKPPDDPLTGLPIRSGFETAMTERMDLYLASGLAFAVVVLDVDDLRSINDGEGTAVGDETLLSLVGTLQRLLRPEDQVFRMDGDEFAVLLPGRDVDSAVRDLERVLHFSRRPASGVRPCSFSCGVSAVPGLSTDPDIVVRQAEAALAWAKDHGRSAVEAYDADRDRVPDQPHDIANLAVREVVAGRLLTPVYQPIVDLRTGRILGFEGLIRPDPNGPLPDADHLFAAASASGRTVELDIACVEVVLAGARAIGPDRLLTLNLSPRTLEVKDFDAGWLLDLLFRNGISPGRVILELTERDAISDLRRLRKTFSHLQDYGLRLAADDVGAGNSGLRLLSQVQFDIVKIDLSLVQGGVHHLGSRTVLESLRDLAFSQQARIVAEGVETREQLQVITDLDIGAGQGYLLGRPIASVEATFVDVRRLASGVLLPPAAVPSSVAATSPSALDTQTPSPTRVSDAMTRRPLAWGATASAAAHR